MRAYASCQVGPAPAWHKKSQAPPWPEPIPAWLGLGGLLLSASFLYLSVFAGPLSSSQFMSATPPDMLVSASPDELLQAVTPENIHNCLVSMGAAGRLSYGQFQIFDLLAPLLYWPGYSLALAYLLQPWRHKYTIVNAIILAPLAAAFMDSIENTCALQLLSVYPARSTLELLFGIAIAAKLAFAGLALVSAVVASLVRPWQNQQRPAA